MLDLGVREESSSPWQSPPVLAPNSDISMRFCVDYWCLNKITLFYAYPMTWVDTLLDKIGEAQVLSTLALTKGNWQILLAKADRQKMALATPSGFTIESYNISFGRKQLGHLVRLPAQHHSEPQTKSIR